MHSAGCHRAACSPASPPTTARLRYRPGITPADRVIHKGKPYNITSLIDYKSANRGLVLMCRG